MGPPCYTAGSALEVLCECRKGFKKVLLDVLSARKHPGYNKFHNTDPNGRQWLQIWQNHTLPLPPHPEKSNSLTVASWEGGPIDHPTVGPNAGFDFSNSSMAQRLMDNDQKYETFRTYAHIDKQQVGPYFAA